MCNTLNPLPEYKREVHRTQLQAAADAGVTTLAGIYHACHRELCSHERDWPFEVVNFLELVGESMGLTRPDLFKRLKLMQDVDAVLADAAPMIASAPGSIWTRRARWCCPTCWGSSRCRCGDDPSASRYIRLPCTS